MALSTRASLIEILTNKCWRHERGPASATRGRFWADMDPMKKHRLAIEVIEFEARTNTSINVVRFGGQWIAGTRHYFSNLFGPLLSEGSAYSVLPSHPVPEIRPEWRAIHDVFSDIAAWERTPDE